MNEYYLKPSQKMNLRSVIQKQKLQGNGFCLSYRDRKAHLVKLQLEDGDLQVQPNDQVLDIQRPSSFQYDPEQVARLAKALKQLLPIRKRMAELRKRISKSEFQRVKRRNTKWTRGWIRVKPSRTMRTPIPEQYSWELRWMRTERITVYEYYRRLLRRGRLRPRTRAELYAKIRWYDDRPSVRAKLKPTKYWYSDPVWIKRLVIPEGSLGSRLTPIKEFKAFPIVDWNTIHTQWARRLDSVRRELRVLDARKRSLEEQVARLQPMTGEYNALLEEQDTVPLATSKPSNLTLIGLPTKGRDAPEIGGWTFEPGFMYSSTNEQCEVIALVTQSREESDMWHRWGGYSLPPHSSEQEVRTTFEPHQRRGSYAYRQPSDVSTTSIRRPTVVNLDDVDALVKDFEDRRSLALASLRNLNLRRDEVEFNWFRSLGELKDTPDTVRTGKAFFDFVKGATGRKYVDVWTTGGHHHQLDLDTLSAAQRSVATRKLSEYTLNGHRLKRSRALAAVGWKRVKLKTVTKATGLSILASVYLSWKFAIAPTISDIQKLIGNGREYVFAIRRGLGQLVRTHGVHFWTLRSLRRQFSATSMNMHGVNWRKPGQHVIDTRPQLAVHSEVCDTLTFCEANPTSIVEFVLCRRRAPYFDRQWGIRYFRFELTDYWLPGLSPEDRGGYSEEEYLRIICNHNLEVCEQILEEYSPTVYVSQHLSGTTFAKFKANELERALGMSQTTIKEALGLQVSGLNVYQTVWDLLPLSFVLEWFTNLRTCAQACNNVVNMALTGLSPHKAAWQTLKTQVWASQPAPVEATVREDMDQFDYWYVTFFRQQSYGSATYYWAEGTEFVVPTLSFKRVVNGVRDPKAGILLRTAMHRVVRKPVDRATPLIPKPRIRISITPPQAGSLAAMLLGSK